MLPFQDLDETCSEKTLRQKFGGVLRSQRRTGSLRAIVLLIHYTIRTCEVNFTF